MIGFGTLIFHMLKEMSSKKLVEGLPLVNVSSKLYRNCVVEKHHITSFPKSSSF